jgi:hypothetical protein
MLFGPLKADEAILDIACPDSCLITLNNKTFKAFDNGIRFTWHTYSVRKENVRVKVVNGNKVLADLQVEVQAGFTSTINLNKPQKMQSTNSMPDFTLFGKPKPKVAEQEEVKVEKKKNEIQVAPEVIQEPSTIINEPQFYNRYFMSPQQPPMNFGFPSSRGGGRSC